MITIYPPLSIQSNTGFKIAVSRIIRVLNELSLQNIFTGSYHIKSKLKRICSLIKTIFIKKTCGNSPSISALTSAAIIAHSRCSRSVREVHSGISVELRQFCAHRPWSYDKIARNNLGSKANFGILKSFP